MTNRDLLRQFYQQDSTWADLATRYIRAKHPLGKSMKHFLDTDWSRVVTHANEVAGKNLDAQVTPSLTNEILEFVHYSLYPAARDAGFPDSSFTWPDITLDAQESASNYYPIPTFTSGEMMPSYDSVPPEFRARCCASLSRDNVLCVKCDLGEGPAFERVIDLNPIIQTVHHKMVEWHREQHGDVSVSGIGDLFSDALSAVTSVYTNKSVQSLFDTLAPAAASAFIPGGPATLALALKAKDVLVNAKSGDPHAVQTIADVKTAAVTGNDAAVRLMDILNKLNQTLNQKASTTKVSGLRIGSDHRTHSSSSGSSGSVTDHRGSSSGSKPVGGLLGYTPFGAAINYFSKSHGSSSRPSGGVVHAPGSGSSARRLTPATPKNSFTIPSTTGPNGTPIDPTGQFIWVTNPPPGHWERKAADPARAAAQAGYQYDPSTGYSFDPATGQYIDPTTGQPIDPYGTYGASPYGSPYGYPDQTMGYGYGYGQAPYYGPAMSPYGYADPYAAAYGADPYAAAYGYSDPYAAAYGYGAPPIDPSTGLPYGANPNPYGWPTGPGAVPMDYSHIPGHVPGDDYGGAGNPYGYQFSGWMYNKPYRPTGGAGSKLRALYNLGSAV